MATVGGRRLVDRLTSLIESSEGLEGVGKTVAEAFSALVPPGRLKDLLSGTWLGHPAHPMLTDIPIGAWACAHLLDLFGDERHQPSADALIGIGALSALPTAITGLSDYADVGSPEEHRVGAAHALGNTAALALYASSWLARKRGARSTGVALSLLGGGALTVSAFLGGHLSYRLGIGVDQTAFDAEPEDWSAVMDTSELADGEPKQVRVDGVGVLVLRSKDRIYAIADRCSHRGGPLHEGEVDGGTVTCPWHQSRFSLEDGAVLRGPATAPQPSYETRVRDGKVEIRTSR